MRSSDNKLDTISSCWSTLTVMLGIDGASSGLPLMVGTECSSHSSDATHLYCHLYVGMCRWLENWGWVKSWAITLIWQKSSPGVSYLTNSPAQVSKAMNKNTVCVNISWHGISFHPLFPCECAVALSQFLVHTNMNKNWDAMWGQWKAMFTKLLSS